MPDDQLVVALDVGTTKICSIVGEVDREGAVRVLGVGHHSSEGLRKGIVVDVESASRDIRAAVDAASQATGLKVQSVVVGVTGEHVSSMTSHGATDITHTNREITESDVQKVMEMARSIPVPEGREIIHVLPRGFAVDGQDGVRQPVGMSGCRLEVETHVITGGASFLQNVLKSVELAGLSVDAIVLEPIATSEAVLTEAEKEVGVIVADIGGGTTDVAIVQNGVVAYSAIIPVGGNHVTGDLAAGLRTSRAEAERVKKDYGCALVSMVADNDRVNVPTAEGDRVRQVLRQEIADIIEPRMQELYSLILNELKRSGLQHTVSGIILSGGGSLLHGAPELAEEIFGMPARIGRPRNLGGSTDALESPVFATAVGLLYFGAARRFRDQQEASVQGFLRKAWGQVRRWVGRFIQS